MVAGALLERTLGDYSSHTMHLLQRLDYNGFYTRRLGLGAATVDGVDATAASATDATITAAAGGTL